MTEISAGARHACALKQNGAVICWGANESGQLGDGSTISRSVALGVNGLSSGVMAMSAGGIAASDGVYEITGHTCALTTTGGVKCWGANDAGQLGNGTTAPSSVPVDVIGLASGVAAISAGGKHSCAVTTAGAVKCWGSNGSGELGDGTLTQQTTPVDVVGLSSGVVAVAAAHRHTCALTSGGAVRCWGANESGQLGNGSTSDSLVPVQVSGLTSGVMGISVARAAGGKDGITLRGGGTSCAVRTTGATVCWGANHSGQLANSTGVASTTPIGITGLGAGTTTDVSVGSWSTCRFGLADTQAFSHSCARTTAGGIKCWGGNHYEALGLPRTTAQCGGDDAYRTTPTDVPGLAVDQIAVAAGSAFTCSLANDTKVRCWGLNGEGQLGAGESFNAANSSTPFFRATPSTVMQPDAIAPDLVLTQVRTPSPASAGKDVVFTYTIVNNGGATTDNVTLQNNAPVGSTYVWASPTCSQGSNSVTCFLGTLASGAGAQVKVVFRPVAAGTMDNTATVSGSVAESGYANNSSSTTTTVNATPAGVPVLRYRLYSDVSKEHHFTTDLNEYVTLGGTGWTQEGTVGKLLDNPGSYNGVAAVPYYRLYDNSRLWHHWTSDPNEYYTLIEFPWWSAEGVDGWILPTQASGTTPLYRLLYPFIAGLHHWTIDAYEYSVLTTQYGWVGEGGSGFVIP